MASNKEIIEFAAYHDYVDELEAKIFKARKVEDRGLISATQYDIEGVVESIADKFPHVTQVSVGLNEKFIEDNVKNVYYSHLTKPDVVKLKNCIYIENVDIHVVTTLGPSYGYEDLCIDQDNHIGFIQCHIFGKTIKSIADFKKRIVKRYGHVVNSQNITGL